MALNKQQAARLASRLWSDSEYATFAVLDGAGIAQLLDKLEDAPGLEFACLFELEIGSDIAHVAPYLVRVLPDSEFSAWLLAGWGERRGIFAQVPAALEMPMLRRHFRKLNIVYGDGLKALLFRFYDPSVLRKQLPDCTPIQVRQIFGPVCRFVLENGAQGGVTMSATGSSELVQEFFFQWCKKLFKRFIPFFQAASSTPAARKSPSTNR